MRKSGIYQITNISNGKKYIGSAVDLDERRWHHLGRLKAKKHYNAKLQNSWNKYGENSFSFSVIEFCEKRLLIEREQFYIDTMKPEYNISPTAGSNLGSRRSQKARDAMKGNKHALGFVCREETKEKIRIARVGKKLTDEAKKKVSDSRKGNTDWLGRKHTKESREKMSIAAKKRYSKTAAQQSVHLTAFGAGGRGQIPLQGLDQADDPSATHGGR